MSATATNSQTPAAEPTDADNIDTTEADVLAALGVTEEAATETASAQPAAAESEGEGSEPAATDEQPAAGDEPAATDEAPAAELTPEQKEIAALKQQLADLAAKIPAAAPAPVAPPVAADRPPLSSTAPEIFDTVTDAGELAARELSLGRLHAWALRNEDGGKIGDHDISRQEALELKASTWEALHQHIPARRQHLAAVAHAEGEAVTAYPALKDPASAESKAVAQFLTENPALRKLPNATLIAADAAIGRLTRTSKPKAGQPAAAPAPRQQPPRAPASAARPGVLPPRTSPRASDLKSASERLSKGTGTVDEIASVIAASLPE